MPAAHTLFVFALVAIGFMAIPGPSNLFVVGQGLQAGTRAAIGGAAGCATGGLVYVAATAAGLSALIVSSRPLFEAVHYVGAAYLCWLGVSALVRRDATAFTGDGAAGRSPRQAWRRGVLVELGNPKVALFFLALFPQFVATQGSAALQVLVLGTVFVAIGLASDCLYALSAGQLSAWLRLRPSRARRSEQATGLLYLGLGGWAATSSR